MLIDEFRDWRDNEQQTDQAKKVLFAVLNDLFSRSGFGNMWDDVDSVTREELLTTNLRIVRENLA